MAGFFKAKTTELEGVEFWHNPERAGWLMKQGTQLSMLAYELVRCVSS